MKNILIFGKDYTVQEQKSEKDSILHKEDVILIETNTKPANTILKDHLTELLYNQLFKIYDQVRKEGKIETLGDMDFEVVEKIDNKKERVAKLKGNKILVKINAITLPEEAFRYIIAHEIAHIFNKKHTKRFWKIVETINPSYKEGQDLLAKYRDDLSRSFKL